MSPTINFAFVGTSLNGIRGRGKMSPKFFIGAFSAVAKGFGCHCLHYNSVEEFISAINVDATPPSPRKEEENFCHTCLQRG